MPGAVLTQVNPSGSIFVAFQNAGGNFGWLIMRRLPTRKSPESRRLMLFTVGVHSGQRSTSFMTWTTRSVGASMSKVMNCVSMHGNLANPAEPGGPCEKAGLG